jgi:hypothetical protein
MLGQQPGDAKLSVELVALLAASAAALWAGGCGGTTNAYTTSEGSGSGPERTYCEFVSRDGRRFKCLGRRFELSHPNASGLAHDKACTPLSRLPVQVVPSRLLTALARARACLTNHGFRVTGGTLGPGERTPSTPEAELIAGNRSDGAFIAFYTDSRSAQRIEPELTPFAHRFGGRVERRGAVTVVWIRPPASGLRTSVQACAFA